MSFVCYWNVLCLTGKRSQAGKVPVILSVAKDLVLESTTSEILHCVRDDSKCERLRLTTHPQSLLSAVGSRLP